MSQSGRRAFDYTTWRNCESSPVLVACWIVWLCLLKIHYISWTCTNVALICTSWTLDHPGLSHNLILCVCSSAFSSVDYFACHFTTPKMCWSTNQRRLLFSRSACRKHFSAKNNSVNSILNTVTKWHCFYCLYPLGSSLKKNWWNTFQWKVSGKRQSILGQHSKEKSGQYRLEKTVFYPVSSPELVMQWCWQDSNWKILKSKGKSKICPEVWQLLISDFKFPFQNYYFKILLTQSK